MLAFVLTSFFYNLLRIIIPFLWRGSQEYEDVLAVEKANVDTTHLRDMLASQGMWKSH